MRLVPLLVSALIALSLAGCSNDAGGQSVAQDGNLAYNGTSSGSHSSKLDCDGSGHASFNANLAGGSVTVTVKDSAGKTVFSKSAASVGQKSETGDVSGTAGEWTLSATRTAGFTGQYTLNVDC